MKNEYTTGKEAGLFPSACPSKLFATVLQWPELSQEIAEGASGAVKIGRTKGLTSLCNSLKSRT
jgi:hypothetical protein